MNAYKLRNTNETMKELFQLYREYDRLQKRAFDLFIETQNVHRILKAGRLQKNLQKKANTYYDAWSLLTERQATEIENSLLFNKK